MFFQTVPGLSGARPECARTIGGATDSPGQSGPAGLSWTAGIGPTILQSPESPRLSWDSRDRTSPSALGQSGYPGLSGTLRAARTPLPVGGGGI